jgi:membrane associated rhomboid family serine protease
VTLLTYGFLHGGVLHLVGNMVGLAMFGPHVEEALGRLEYLLFYVGGSIAAGLLHVVVSHALLPVAAAVPMVGASGALFAVLGLFAVRFYRAHVRVFLVANVPAVWAVGGFVLFEVMRGLLAVADGGRSESTANWAHVGGFLFGMLIAVPLRMREDGRHEYRREDAVLAAQSGRWNEAAALYRQVLADSPDDVDAHRSLARLCAQLGQGEAAHRHFQDALRLSLKSARPTLTAGIYEEITQGFRAFPLPASLLQRVGSACEEAQCFGLALRAFGDLCRDFPRAPEAEIALLRMGRLHLERLGQPNSAEGILEEFLRLYPSSEWRSLAARLLGEARQVPRPGPVPAPGPG